MLSYRKQLGERYEIGLFIINGRPIKSINQFYNKKRALLQARLSTFGKKTSRELIKLTDWRNQKITDYIHKASRFVIRHCLDNKLLSAWYSQT